MSRQGNWGTSRCAICMTTLAINLLTKIEKTKLTTDETELDEGIDRYKPQTTFGSSLTRLQTFVLRSLTPNFKSGSISKRAALSSPSSSDSWINGVWRLASALDKRGITSLSTQRVNRLE